MWKAVSCEKCSSDTIIFDSIMKHFDDTEIKETSLVWQSVSSFFTLYYVIIYILKISIENYYYPEIRTFDSET